jgi:hypothetical protein
VPGYRELTDAVKNNFDRLTHAFVYRYRTNTSTVWQDTAAAWTLKQGPQQTVVIVPAERIFKQKNLNLGKKLRKS